MLRHLLHCQVRASGHQVEPDAPTWLVRSMVCADAIGWDRW